MTLLFARQSVELCFKYLAIAYEEPFNLEARIGMAYASLYAALSYASAGLNAVHGLAYGLAGLTHQTHGATNAVFLPYVMDSLISLRQSELAEIGKLAGSSVKQQTELAKDAVRLTKQLIERLGLASDLPSFGVTIDDLPKLIADGLAVARLTKAYPSSDPGQAYKKIVEYAFKGQLLE